MARLGILGSGGSAYLGVEENGPVLGLDSGDASRAVLQCFGEKGGEVSLFLLAGDGSALMRVYGAFGGLFGFSAADRKRGQVSLDVHGVAGLSSGGEGGPMISIRGPKGERIIRAE